MYLLPLLNMKSLTALNMLMEAANTCRLEDLEAVVENSSGNTACSLAVLSRVFGVRQFNAIVPWDVAPGQMTLLNLLGVSPLLSKGPPVEPTGISRAREMGRQPGYLNPGQYENEANPGAHQKWTAPQIWKQTNGMVTVFCAGLGTIGTLIGVSRYFRKQLTPVAVVGVNCQADHAVPGVRTLKRLDEVSLDWRSAIDYRIEVTAKDSYKRSLQLCRRGLMAGPSSGFALAGLLKFLEEKRAAGELDKLRNKEGEILAVFVCADTALPYLEKYSTILDPADFHEG